MVQKCWHPRPTPISYHCAFLPDEQVTQRVDIYLDIYISIDHYRSRNSSSEQPSVSSVFPLYRLGLKDSSRTRVSKQRRSRQRTPGRPFVVLINELSFI